MRKKKKYWKLFKYLCEERALKFAKINIKYIQNYYHKLRLKWEILTNFSIPLESADAPFSPILL